MGWLCGLLLAACGGTTTPPGDGGVSPGDGGVPHVHDEAWTELAPKTMNVVCRPVVGATFKSLDPSAPQHWRANASNVLLRSDDEGRTWTRAPMQASLSFIAAGPVLISQGRVDPLQLNGAPWLASPDRGATWQPLTWTNSTNASLPLGSLEADIGATTIAWTPTGLVRFSTDHGDTWHVEPDAYLDVGGDDWRTALGDREWQVSQHEQSLFRSRDRGRTWERLTWHRFRSARLVGDDGVVAAEEVGGGPSALWVSRDDGATWARRPGFTPEFAVGPADGEIWAITYAAGTETPRLMHSLDWGTSFEPVTLSLGPAGNATAVELKDRVWALADGRRVGLVARVDAQLDYSSVVCVESTAAGALEQPTPSKDDTPGTATFWAEGKPGMVLGSTQQVVPLAEPGRAVWSANLSFTDALSINGLTRTPSGDVAVLAQPVPVLDRGIGPPMFVRELDATTLAPTVITKFDNLLELGTSGQSKMLESHRLSVWPDGTYRTDTAEGDYPLGGMTAMWAPWPSGSHWGRQGSPPTLSAAAVTFDTVGATQVLRLSRDLTEAAVFCDANALPTERCVSYAGHVADWAYRNDRVYVLDDWRGEVLEASYAALDNTFRPVLTGLANPTSLFMPIDDEPGLYVVDTHLYRVVPGLTPARRP